MSTTFLENNATVNWMFYHKLFDISVNKNRTALINRLEF